MANHVGIIAISGSVMASPATRVGVQTLTPTGVLHNIFTSSYVAGTEISEYPSPEMQQMSGTEVINFNTYYAGDEVIFSSGGQEITRPVYLSKESRFNFFSYKRLTSILDVMKNIPQSIPSGAYSATLGSVTASENAASFNIMSSSISPAVPSSSFEKNIITIHSGSDDYVIATTSVDDLGGGIWRVNFNKVLVNGEFKYSNDLNPIATGAFVPTGTLISSKPLYDPVSGVFLNRTAFDPSSIEVGVSESGRIRDVKVWVEYVNDCRNVTFLAAHPEQGLQNIQISLRNPNTNFVAAHPLWNDPNTFSLPFRYGNYSGSDNKFGSFYYQIPELLRNSYLLWAGHRVDLGSSEVAGTPVLDVSASYHEFDRDLDMRTIFWDGSPVNNPRDLTVLYPSASILSTGSQISTASLTSTLTSSYQSPTLGASKYGWAISPSLTCSNIPWFVDSDIIPGALPADDKLLTASVTVPPAGWLSGREPQVIYWDSASFTSSQNNMFSAGALLAAPLRNMLFVVGGENVDGAGTVSAQAARATYAQNNDIQVVHLFSSSFATRSNIPAGRGRMGSTSYTIGDNSYMILIGGSTSQTDNIGTKSVSFGKLVGDDIIWSSAPDFAFESLWPSVIFFSNKLFVVGGLSGGLPTNVIYSSVVDPQTGMPQGWDQELVIDPSTGITSLDQAFIVDDMPRGNIPAFIVATSGSSFWEMDIGADGKLSPPAMVNKFSEIGTQFSASTQLSDNFFPLTYNNKHVFAVSNNQESSGTCAANISFRSGSNLITMAPFETVGPGCNISGSAASGSSISIGNSIFVAGAGFSGSNAPYWSVAKIFSANAIVQTTGADEFPTFGKQLGPSTIRPVYPMMDDIYSFKMYDYPSDRTQIPANRGVLRGFRPGLRNVEANGVWNVMFGSAADSWNDNTGYSANSSSGIWCRQIRLEMTLDVSSSTYEFTPSRARKWYKPFLVPGGEGYHIISVESGSTLWDAGLNYTQIFQQPEYGRTVGITSLTATSPDSFAVQTFITGNLFTYLSSSGIVDPVWYLNGPSDATKWFGTPYIPDSSMSLNMTGTAEQIDKSASLDIYTQTVGQTTVIPNANTMADLLARERYATTTADKWEQVNNSASQVTGSYFGF